MSDKNIEINYETISVSDQRELIEATRSLSRALTPEDYKAIMSVYSRVVVERLTKKAKKQGVEI